MLCLLYLLWGLIVSSDQQRGGVYLAKTYQLACREGSQSLSLYYQWLLQLWTNQIQAYKSHNMAELTEQNKLYNDV